MLGARRTFYSTLVRRLHGSPFRHADPFDPKKVDRAQDQVDVCIVGAGPAGLSAAIRLKQLEKERGREVRVVVLEKGAEVGKPSPEPTRSSCYIFSTGSHILSGAVIEPRALNELLPEWRSMSGHPLKQPATSSRMRFLTSKSSIPMPHPPQMSNKGNYILSLSQFAAWLNSIAEEMGVEVYPGFAGAGLVFDEQGAVRGVTTNEVGLDKQGRMKDNFEPGMQFLAKVTLLAEGAHGSLSKSVINQFDLRRNVDPQTYGMGIKEVWRVDESQYRPGEVIHTMGWPLDRKTYGGGWVYHMADGLVSLGLVIGLDYANPYLSPYQEFQVRILLCYMSASEALAAHETPPLLRRAPSQRRTSCVWRSNAQRRWAPVDPKALLPRWRAYRMLCRLCECAQNQGDAQCYEERHARRRGCL